MSTDKNIHPFSILIVDDEPKNIQLLGNLLKKQSYDIEFATSGEQAIEWMTSKRFDLVLLDIMMPGMNGYDVCKKIKSNIKISHIPIIFITAKTQTEDIVKGFEAGGSDYITKPFNSPELLARVKMHVEMKQLRGLLPICSNCKAIRDEDGVWKKFETYIQEHSSAMFSHSICPKCVKELYPDLDLDSE